VSSGAAVAVVGDEVPSGVGVFALNGDLGSADSGSSSFFWRINKSTFVWFCGKSFVGSNMIAALPRTDYMRKG